MLETRFVRVVNFQKRACLFTFSSRNVLSTVHKHTFDAFVSKAQNEWGILLFLQWKLENRLLLKES